MTTKPSIGKRLLGAMLAVPMALAGMGNRRDHGGRGRYRSDQ